MASERFLSEHSSRFWRHILPELSTDYLRQKNASSRQDTLESAQWESPAIYNDLIGETAFGCLMRHITSVNSATTCNRNEQSSRLASYVKADTSDLQYGIDSLTVIAGKRFDSFPIPECVISDASILAKRLARLLPGRLSSAKFHPRLKGVGILDACHPDIAIEDVLIEVKTSRAGFRLEDFRQLFIYAYLSHRSERKFSKFYLLNPRTAQILGFTHQQLCHDLSGLHYSKTYTLFDQILQI